MTGIDDAASAFDADMGGSTHVSSATGSDAPVEQLFRGVGDLENPNEAAGGDDAPLTGLPETRKQSLRRDKEEDEVEEDTDDLDAEIYNGKGDDEEEDSDHLTSEDVEEEEDEEDGEDGKFLTIPDDAKLRIIVDGKPLVVTGKQAREGFIRGATFHQRLNKLNEGKQIVQREAAKLMEDRKQALFLINSLGEDIKALVPKEPNWDQLYATDPKSAREMQKNYEGLRNTLATLAANRARIIAEAEKDAERRTAQYAADEAEKFDALNPAWATDPQRKQKDLVAMVRTGLASGFTAEELDATYDSRMLQVLLKASKYDRIVASRPKPNKRGKNPVNSGSGTRRVNGGTGARGATRAARQLQRTGSVEDAANVFQSIIR